MIPSVIFNEVTKTLCSNVVSQIMTSPPGGGSLHRLMNSFLCHNNVFVNGDFPPSVNRRLQSPSGKHSLISLAMLKKMHCLQFEMQLFRQVTQRFLRNKAPTKKKEKKKRAAQPLNGYPSVPAIVTAR